MKINDKQQIIKRRKEIEQELLDILKETKSDFGLEDIVNVIYNEKGNDDMMKIIAMFDRGDISELENILEVMNDAWNYFPHKSLSGLSPSEMMLKYENENNKGEQTTFFKNKKLTAKQKDLLWSGDNSPYSQVNLIKQARILDNSISRIFLVVEAEINPTTFEIVKQDRDQDEFKSDIMIQQLLDSAEYRGPQLGYIAMSFEAEYKDDRVMIRAEHALKYTQKSIIKMHDYVMREYI